MPPSKALVWLLYLAHQKILVDIGQAGFILLNLAGQECPRLPAPLGLNTQL